MIPGKEYTPELIFQIAWRRKWFILIPAVLIACGVSAWTYRLTDVYVSVAAIQVVPQRVSEDIVKASAAPPISERLSSLKAQITSRTKLERLITDLNLYPVERPTAIMEDLYERMKNDIVVRPAQSDVFTVSFYSDDASTAMRVADRLASMFIDESSRDKGLQTESTNQFLEAQLEATRQELKQQEQKMDEVRKKFDGQLPTQLDGNRQAFQATQMLLGQLTDALNRDRDKEIELTRRINDLLAMETTALPQIIVGGPGTAHERLGLLKKQLNDNSFRLKPGHPDMVALRKQIAETEALAEAESAQITADPTRLTPAEFKRNADLEDARKQLAATQKSIQLRTENEEKLRQELKGYQARIGNTPVAQAELTEASRDYPTVSSSYQTLAEKKQESDIQANLERRAIGEQFKLLEAPRKPARPDSPNRPRYYMLGILGGIMTGLALAGTLEYLDRTMRSEDDVRTALGMPVLAAIPFVLNPVAERRRFKIVAVSASAAVVLLAGAAVVAWTYLKR